MSSNEPHPHRQARDGPPDVSRLARYVRPACLSILAAAVLVVGGGLAHYWLTNRPRAHRRPPHEAAALVEVAQVKPSDHRVTVRAMGTVVAAQTIQLAARISGQIVHVSPEFLPGGRFEAGRKILQVDPSDYELAVQQRQSEVTKAESDLKLEMGRQAVAKREYELLGETIRPEDRELVLREPQLRATEAALAAARASLRKAKLDLERTAVRAPFNAIVQSKNVGLGSQVSVGQTLAALVDTDEYWVQVAVPTDELRWIDIPDGQGTAGATARIHHEAAWGKGALRTGTVERLMTELEPHGRMARLLVLVKDPLRLTAANAKRPRLILGAYVRVEIAGKRLRNVVLIPRVALRDGCRVWIMLPDGTLDVREVNIVRRTEGSVCVSDNLREGELLITSNLPAPVPGMALRKAGAGNPSTSTQPGKGGATRRPQEKRP